MKKKFHFGTKIILVSCITIVFTAFFISFFSYDKYQKSMESKISGSVIQAFVQANEMIDYNIESYENLLHLTTANYTVKNILGTTFENQFDWFTSERRLTAETNQIAITHTDVPDIKYYLLRQQNIIMSSSYVTLSKMLPDDFVEKNLSSNGVGYVWSDICESKSWNEKEYFLIISKLCKNDMDGSEDAIVYIPINIKNLFKSIDKLEYEGGDFLVLTPDNEILYDQKFHDIGAMYENESLTSKIKHSSSGMFIETIQGNKYLIVYNSENKKDWTLLGIFPYKTIMSEISLVSNIVLGVTVIVTLFAFLIVFLYLHTNTKKITLLSNAMEEVQNEKLEVQLHLKGHGEINRMADVFLSMLSRIRNQIGALEEARQREHKLELRALQEQINPHLLYNTLAMINSYAEEIDAQDISHVVMSLIAYYKLTLSEGMEFISVRDELAHAKAYIEIMKTRFENYLTVDMEIEPEVYPFSCPKLILQPFIENSIYHGFGKNDHYQGTITLQACLRENRVVFQIEDNGCGMSEEKIEKIMKERGNSYAVKNVDARIKLYYGNDYGIHIISSLGAGCKVIITIPAVK